MYSMLTCTVFDLHSIQCFNDHHAPVLVLVLGIGIGIQVGQHTFTDIDYADDAGLLVDKEESFCTALAAVDEEASKFGFRVTWTKTKIQNLVSRSTPLPVTVDGK